MLSNRINENSLKDLDAGLDTESLKGLNILSQHIGDLQLLGFGKRLISMKLG